jgi:hypothetical protein
MADRLLACELESTMVEADGDLTDYAHEMVWSRRRIAELEAALVTAAIPLEALLATECDTAGTALSRAAQDGIREGVTAIRAALRITTQPEGDGNGG